MGSSLFDQYSLLHFAVGVIAYFWGVRFGVFLAAHILFEWLENTTVGMQLIRRFAMWPGGKNVADSLLNRVGDVISGQVGWLAASLLDTAGKKRRWYDSRTGGRH